MEWTSSPCAQNDVAKVMDEVRMAGIKDVAVGADPHG
jgi:hypothetical protein